MISDWSDFIRTLKVQSGLSSAEISRRLDVRPQLLNDIEQGRSKNPSSDFVFRLIDRMNLSPEYFAGNGPMFRTQMFHGETFDQESKYEPGSLLPECHNPVAVCEVLVEKAGTLGRRLVMARSHWNFTETDYVSRLGIDLSTLRSLENAPEVPVGAIRKMVFELGVDPNWLLTGEGKFLLTGDEYISLRSQNEPHRPAKGRKDDSAEPIELPSPTEFSQIAFRRGQALVMNPDDSDRDRMVLLPIFGQRVAAGPGQETLEVQEVEDLIPVVQELLGHHKPEHCALLRVSGDSMTEMQINNGDRVIFDKTDRKGDGVYVITHNQEVRVKRLRFRVSERTVLIISENRRYPEPEVESFAALEDGRLIIEGKVIGWLHRHLY